MRLIDKEYFIGAMEESKRIHGEYSVSINNFINSLKFAPTIDAEPVRHGHWIAVSTTKRERIFKCSVCRNVLDFDGVNAGRGDANYCPNCGAKMLGGE